MFERQRAEERRRERLQRLEQAEQRSCFCETVSLKSKHTEQVEKRRSGSMWKSVTDQPGIYASAAEGEPSSPHASVGTGVRQVAPGNKYRDVASHHGT